MNWKEELPEKKAPKASDEWSNRGKSGKKNTKKWCKGKVGREHVPVVTMNHSMVSMMDRFNKEVGGPYCTPVDDEGPRWTHCIHQISCEVCSKVLSYGVETCPTTGEKIR